MLPYIEFLEKNYPMYGICIVLGLFAAAFFMIYDCKKNNVLWENAVIIGLSGVFFGFLGAKLLYLIVTYTPKELLEMIREKEFESLISGGFVFYGGLIAGVISTFFVAKLLKSNIRDYENTLIKIIPLVHCFGRIGCFCSGCCYGKPTTSPIHVIFEEPLSDAPAGVPLIPTQLYEAGFNFILFLVLWFIDRKFKLRILLPIYLLAYGAERFIIEFFRYDEIRGIYFGFSTSQWISIAIFAIGTALLAYRIKQKG